MPHTIYKASRIKRNRATKNEIEARRWNLFRIVEAMRPMTVRQVFYQATVRGIVEKSEAGYCKVQTDLVQMRRAGMMPYGWLADNTRWQRKPRSFGGIKEALNNCAECYRKDLWRQATSYVEIWLEKDALAGVILSVTAAFDVPLMVSRGYASLSFLHSAASAIGELEIPAYIYHLGDFDPSGVNAGEKIEETLCDLAPNAKIVFQRLAVTPEQIEAWALPTRPTKTSDTRSKGFGGISVELDAIEPERLRNLVEIAIERHLPPEQFELLKVAEESERQAIMAFVRGGRVMTARARLPKRLPATERQRFMMTHRIALLAPQKGHGKTSMSCLGQPIGASDSPIYAAARWLLANGMASPDDTVATFRGETLCMSGKAGELAKWTAHERDSGAPSLELVRYRPFPTRGEAQKPASPPPPVPTYPEPELASPEL